MAISLGSTATLLRFNTVYDFSDVAWGLLGKFEYQNDVAGTTFAKYVETDDFGTVGLCIDDEVDSIEVIAFPADEIEPRVEFTDGDGVALEEPSDAIYYRFSVMKHSEDSCFLSILTGLHTHVIERDTTVETQPEDSFIDV